MGNTTKKFNFNDIVIQLIADLNDREQEVIAKRYALAGNPKHTLEKIGRAYDITRERVRQIEAEGLRKIKELSQESSMQELQELRALVDHFIVYHGGFIGHEHLMDNLLHTREEQEERALDFILEHVVGSQLQKLQHEDFDVVWASHEMKKEDFEQIATIVNELIDRHEKPLTFEEILGTCPTCTAFPKINELSADNHAIIEALLKARKDLAKNILGQWGKTTWTTIKPKRMTDKAYLVMLKEQRPLHFEECADLINQANFDKKKACAATVHNELILDNKYVLVGRGMYALKDWGYQEGTVSDVIEKVLKEKGTLTKAQLADEVLKQRMVQKTTITLALMNKDRFIRQSDGTYALAK